MRLAGKGEQLQKLSQARRALYAAPEIEYWNVPVWRSLRTASGYDDTLIERPAQQTELTRRYTEEAIRFIQQNRDGPFLLYVPYSMPHTPIFRSEAFAGRSLGGRYGDVIEEIDWSVGAIVDRLEALGLAENTLVLFTSDNGPWLTMNQHGGTAGLLRHGKGTTFEGGMRVPAVFSWPGSLEPGVVSDIGSTLDVFVTALALAGAAPAEVTDGFDLSATLLDGAPTPRSSMPYYRQGELRAFRQGEFKLHLITEGAYGQPPERTEHDRPVLYRLTDDPGEKFDVASQHPEVVASILSAIEQHRQGMTERPPLFDTRLNP
jgi:arylsulfatase A-like enzyme